MCEVLSKRRQVSDYEYYEESDDGCYIIQNWVKARDTPTSGLTFPTTINFPAKYRDIREGVLISLVGFIASVDVGAATPGWFNTSGTNANAGEVSIVGQAVTTGFDGNPNNSGLISANTNMGMTTQSDGTNLAYHCGYIPYIDGSFYGKTSEYRVGGNSIQIKYTATNVVTGATYTLQTADCYRLYIKLHIRKA